MDIKHRSKITDLWNRYYICLTQTFEIQKTDNYIDWTSLSYVELTGTTFSSRTIPVGADSEIDVATLTFSMPIWLSPPVKVKKLGVVQKIIMSIYDDDGGIAKGLIDGELTSRSYHNTKQFWIVGHRKSIEIARFNRCKCQIRRRWIPYGLMLLLVLILLTHLAQQLIGKCC